MSQNTTFDRGHSGVGAPKDQPKIGGSRDAGFGNTETGERMPMPTPFERDGEKGE